MNPAEQLSKAIAVAAVAHEGVLDKGGEPYILHALNVMAKVADLGPLAQAAAVMHDVVEDTETTLTNLRLMGFDDSVVATVALLTKPEELEYMAYIKQLSGVTWARRIKMADLEHNSMVSRLPDLTKRDFDRLEKYATAYRYLKKV